MEFEVCLVCVHHAIKPREKLLRTVIGVEDDRDAIRGSDRSNVVGSSNGTCNGGFLVTILDSLHSCQFGTSQHTFQELVPFQRNMQRLLESTGG